MRFLTNISYADSESVQYENLGAYCANQAMASQGVTAFTGAIRMTMTFSFLIPVSRACKKHPAPTEGCKRLHPGDLHTQRPDLDNCIKSVLDFGNSIIFADDCIVAKMTGEKFWGLEGRAEIVVEEI